METILQLSFDEKKVLESIYGRQIDGVGGYNPRKLESIKDLTATERRFFAGKNFVSPYFFVQTLYKIRGIVNPVKFNIAVNKMLAEDENLRANFCNLGTRTIKVINSAAVVKPEVIFRNLTTSDADELDDTFRKILEADMRRNVDLRHDPLIRFAIYKTSEQEFAVLVTIAQLISESFDVEKFFCKITHTTVEIESPKTQPDLQPKNQEAIRDYWAKILDKAPPPAALPCERNSSGAYRQQTFRTTIPVDILSEMRGRAQSHRLMLTAILQSAWGFMLQLTNKRRDCLFCQILSAENFSLNVIPVRLIGDNNSTVEQIVRQQFRQLVVSQPYSCIDWADLSDLTGQRKLFDHFLSFKEFRFSELNYVAAPAQPQGKLVYRNSWDAQGMKLGAYFRYSENNLSISFLYDAEKFVNRGVEQLCSLYEFILQQMLVDWNAKFPQFQKNLAKRAEMQTNFEETPREDEQKKIRNFLSQLPILQGRYGGTIGLFEGQAKIITRYEGDRISGDALKKNFIFVMDGKLARNIDIGDGWYNPLDIIAKNSFVNPANLLERQRLTLSAEVLTEQTELLTIPHDVFIEILRKNSEVALSIMNYSLKQMERYQMLWLQS